VRARGATNPEQPAGGERRGGTSRSCEPARLGSVLEGDGVGGDVHLRFVLGDVDDAALAPEQVAQLGTARLARSVEPGLGRRLATRAGDLHAGDGTGRQSCDE